MSQTRKSANPIERPTRLVDQIIAEIDAVLAECGTPETVR